jgi:hypothetical protein
MWVVFHHRSMVWKPSWWQSLKHNVHLSTTSSLSTQITNLRRVKAIARVNEHDNHQKLEQAVVMMNDKVIMMAMKKDGDEEGWRFYCVASRSPRGVSAALR